MSDTKHTKGNLSYRKSGVKFSIYGDQGEIATTSGVHYDNEKNARDLVHRYNTHPALLTALAKSIKIIEDLYQWEPIVAESRETSEEYRGPRRNMPNDMVELDNQAGVLPEEMNENLAELKTALATARA